ncbi:MAG TPA: isoprenylcysteine carboxylmethyltransferase family protein [Candidatus Nanoarchaeia archaeon]|nr:isoprenylcysteine carboxylmethyltransferase family protein [Candidatus Nanoarchaeia archaeon]
MKREIIPPTFFYFGIFFIILLHFIFPFFRIITYPYNLIGIGFVIIGVLLNTWAWLLFIKNKTTQNPFKQPNKFIKIGVYKFSRNPMYLGMLLILIGMSVLSGKLITFSIPLLFWVIINKWYVPIEEKIMEKRFKKDYSKYKDDVRRWI